MKVEKLKHVEEINRVLFRISNATNTTKDMDQLYASIHRGLGRIIDVTNFYIALYDSDKQTLKFPYFLDVEDKESHDLVVDYDTSDSLTGQVIIDKQPVLLNKDELSERKANGRLQGILPLAWLGVPLINDNVVIGVMAVQSYTNTNIFDENDVKVLASVSEQVALAIDRKRAQEALLKSEKRFREISDLLPTILCELDANMRITYLNRIGIEIFGLTLDPIEPGIEVVQLFDPQEERRVTNLMNDLFIGKKIVGAEYRFRKNDKQEMVALIHSSPVVDNGAVAGARLTITDITDRKKTEKERDKLISELKNSLAEVKVLKGIIPICATCKKVRDDRGYWNQVESYISNHSEAEFSHGLCPECMDKMYGGQDWYKKRGREK